MTSSAPIQNVSDLIARLEQVVDADCDQNRCDGVKEALRDACLGTDELLDASFLSPCENGYARRLLHKDARDRFSVMVMVWNGNQGTPLHDHGGRWCVECVYRGRIRVRSFSRVANHDTGAGLWDFRPEQVVVTGQGEAGTLIPPFDYHILENPDDAAAVTIHVYGGELNQCTTFEPVESGGWRATTAHMSYTD